LLQFCPNTAIARLAEFIRFDAKFRSLEGYVLSERQTTFP
jgi:hypothetical protein